MIHKLEMPLEQFAEAVAKENERLQSQYDIALGALKVGVERIEKLEAALQTIYECCDETGNCSVVRRIVRKALEGKDV